MTLLEQYQARREICEMEIEGGSFRQEEMMELQELDYRISVLYTLQSLLASIRRDMGLPVLSWHYRVITTYFDQVAKERKFGSGMDAFRIKERDEALADMEKTIREEKERIRSVPPLDAPDYKKKMGKYFGAVLSAWMRYRQTYIKI
ncbi:MAG: hypothetical protein IJ733_03960 [Lachnospiraceae bacterium]|nr:hypothetical protein [Lachnospiraceae bacterium]